MFAHVALKAGDDDVLRISRENPGWRVERDSAGALLLTPPTGGESSRRNARLTRLMDEWAEKHGFVAFDSNGGFLLPDTSIIAPDAALVPKSLWDSLTPKQREGFVPCAPAVAIEIRSRTDTRAELYAKLAHLRASGTAYAILIDPYEEGIWTDGTPPDGFDIAFHELLK